MGVCHPYIRIGDIHEHRKTSYLYHDSICHDSIILLTHISTKKSCINTKKIFVFERQRNLCMYAQKKTANIRKRHIFTPKDMPTRKKDSCTHKREMSLRIRDLCCRHPTHTQNSSLCESTVGRVSTRLFWCLHVCFGVFAGLFRVTP